MLKEKLEELGFMKLVLVVGNKYLGLFQYRRIGYLIPLRWVTNSNQRFRRNGRLELGSAIANQEYDKQYEYEISHGTDKNGKRYYMPASGRAEYVPVESILVPLPQYLLFHRNIKWLVSFLCKERQM